MSSSVDFRAYCEAGARELDRLSRVYLGAEDDTPLDAQHMVVDHLDKLLAGPLSQSLRTLYMQEYTELRASIRALATLGLTRRDYYMDASAQTAYDASSLRSRLAANESLGAGLVGALSEELQTTLSDLESEYIDRKTATTSNLEASTGFSGDDKPSASDVVREAMKNTPGVSNSGVSRDQARSV